MRNRTYCNGIDMGFGDGDTRIRHARRRTKRRDLGGWREKRLPRPVSQCRTRSRPELGRDQRELG